MVNKILPVCRVIGKSAQQKEVIAVKVLTFIGVHYFEAKIIKGEIKVSDIARKVGTSLLVQLFNETGPTPPRFFSIIYYQLSVR